MKTNYNLFQNRSNLEILNILTEEKESYSLSQIKEAQSIAEKRGLDVYLYINDRETYHRISKREKVVDNRASMKLRIINYILDSIIIALIIVAIDFFINSIGNLKVQLNWDNYIRLWIAILVFSYYVIQEGIWNRTLGKLVTRTIVVTEKNETPTLSEIIRRTACRFIPLEAFSFVFMKDGWHDTISKTKVIEE